MHQLRSFQESPVALVRVTHCGNRVVCGNVDRGPCWCGEGHMPNPNFFIVGAPKCGTTSLYEYLRPHPELFMPPMKEPHFFGSDLQVATEMLERPYIRDKAAYLALFDEAAGCKRLGEASTWYLFSKLAAREIKAFNPHAKIIIMLRNPIEMIYSLHGQFLWTCNETLESFEQAWEAQADRRRGGRIPPESHFPQGLQYAQVASYTEQVKRYLEVFGRSQVMIILFDDFVSDTPEVYGQVLRFLEIDPWFRPLFRAANVAKRPTNIGVKRFLKRRPKLQRGVIAMLPPRLRPHLSRMMNRLTSSRIERPPMSEPMRARLREQFAAQIEDLGELLSRDLLHWCAST